MPVRALVDDCPLYDLAPERPTEPIYPAPRRRSARHRARRRRCWRCSRAPNIASRRPLFEQYDSIVQSRTVRRPEQADAAVLRARRRRGPRRQHRLQRPACRGRPLPRGDGGGARVRGEPRVRRRAGARHDQQPELRQPREAAHRMAADGGRPRARRGLPRAARADRRRQRLALQRGGHRPDLPDAGDRHGRPAAGRRPRRPARLRPSEGDAIALVGPFGPSLDASELSKLRGQPLPDGLPAFDLAGVSAAQLAVREAVRAGALSSAHDIAEGGLAVALAECCLAGAIGARSRPAEMSRAQRRETLFGEGSGGFVRERRRGALAALGGATPVREIGTVAGESLRVSSRRAACELSAR